MVATEKQVSFIARLSAERGKSVPSSLSKSAASQLIGALLAEPVARPASVQGITEPGMYRDAAGSLFKVQASKECGNLYAKALTPIGGARLTDSDEVVAWEFVYAPGAVRSLTAAQRLTVEAAKAFGIRYGVCCVCGLTLKDAKSVAAGIGPICARKV